MKVFRQRAWHAHLEVDWPPRNDSDHSLDSVTRKLAFQLDGHVKRDERNVGICFINSAVTMCTGIRTGECLLKVTMRSTER